MNNALKDYITSNEKREADLEHEAAELEAKAKRDLLQARTIKAAIIKEEKDVADAVHNSVTSWRKSWDSNLKENDKAREADDAAELRRVEADEWSIKQRVVKEAVDMALKKWATELAARVEHARNKRIA